MVAKAAALEIPAEMELTASAAEAAEAEKVLALKVAMAVME